MAITTTCPSCQGQLRVPDDLIGQRVRCPVCQNVFEAAGGAPPPSAPAQDAPAGPAPETPLWKGLNLEMEKSDANGEEKPAAPKPAPARTPGLVGAVEMKLSIDDEAAAPTAPPPPSSPPPRRPAPPPPRRLDATPKPRGASDEDDDYGGRRPSYDRGPRRRDSEPHRGVLILVLGIISLASVFLSCFYGLGTLIGIPLGITAWVLGRGDLRKIKNNEMDEEGLGLTQAGWICGIIGTILHTLVLLTCGGFIAFFLTTMAANQNTAAPRPSFAPPPPPAAPPPAVRD